MASEFITQDRLTRSYTLVDLARTLWPYFRGRWHGLTGIAALVLIDSLLGRALPLIVGQAIDSTLKSGFADSILFFALLYLASEVMRNFAHFAHSYWSRSLAEQVLFELRETLMTHVCHLPVRFFDTQPVGRIVTRLTNDIAGLKQLLSQSMSAIAPSVIEVLVIGATILWISPSALAATLSIMLPAGWGCYRLGLLLKTQFRMSKQQIAAINSFTAETLNGLSLVHNHQLESSRETQFSDQNQAYRNTSLGTVRVYAYLWPLFHEAQHWSVMLLASVFLLNPEALGTTIGELGSLILLSQSLFKPMRVFLEQFTMLQESRANAERVLQVLHEPTEDDDQWNQNQQQSAPIKQFEPTAPREGTPLLAVRNLHFAYNDHTNAVLNGVNFELNRGQSLAIVGRTGAGKSTLVNLLQHFYPIPTNSMFFYGSDMASIPKHELRRHVHVIAQDVAIYRGTLLDNITLLNRNLSSDRIQQAIQLARLETLIRRHPLGLQQPIAERGQNLSAGERQLIALARAWAYAADILVMDEATAQIDSESERQVQTALNAISNDLGLIIIAHRLSTVRDCDSILALAGGQVIEAGSHDELMTRGGYYADLVAAAKAYNGVSINETL